MQTLMLQIHYIMARIHIKVNIKQSVLKQDSKQSVLKQDV